MTSVHLSAILAELERIQIAKHTPMTPTTAAQSPLHELEIRITEKPLVEEIPEQLIRVFEVKSEITEITEVVKLAHVEVVCFVVEVPLFSQPSFADLITPDMPQKST